MLTFAAAVTTGPAPLDWLKLVGSLAAVLALLVLFLKLLNRLQAGRGDVATRLLSTRAVGARRTVETLRCGDVVYTLYQREQALVLLDREPYDPRRHEAPPPPDGGLSTRIARLFGRSPDRD